MTIDQLNEAMHGNPFRPFTIRMADGRSFEVRHRDFISRSPSGRTVAVHGEGDSFRVLDLLLMTELEIHRSDQPDAVA
jgi:hypothetical protein